MTYASLHNALRIMRWIERAELVQAKIIDRRDETAWMAYHLDPFAWMIKADTARGERLFALIDSKQPAALQSRPALNSDAEASDLAEAVVRENTLATMAAKRAHRL